MGRSYKTYQYIFKEVSYADLDAFDPNQGLGPLAHTHPKYSEVLEKLWVLVDKVAAEVLTLKQLEVWNLSKMDKTTKEMSRILSQVAYGRPAEKVDLTDQEQMTSSGYVPESVRYGSYIVCQICKKKLRQIHANHLRNHKRPHRRLTLREYMKKFPRARLYADDIQHKGVSQEGVHDRLVGAIKKIQKTMIIMPEAQALLKELEDLD